MLCLVIWFFWFQFFKLDYIYVGQCRYLSMRGSSDIFHKMFFSSMLKYLVNFKAKARQLPEIFVPYLQQKSKCSLTFKWAPSNQPKSWATLWRMACLVSINSMNLSLYYFLIFWDEFERWCGGLNSNFQICLYIPINFFRYKCTSIHFWVVCSLRMLLLPFYLFFS